MKKNKSGKLYSVGVSMFSKSMSGNCLYYIGLCIHLFQIQISCKLIAVQINCLRSSRNLYFMLISFWYGELFLRKLIKLSFSFM